MGTQIDLVFATYTCFLGVIGISRTDACRADHNLCPAFDVDTKYYCRHEWVRGNCRHMCGRGCYDPDEEDDLFRAGRLGGESCVTDCSGFKDDPVCGTNGKTYANICEIYNDVCRKKIKFSVRGRGTCVCQGDDRSNCKEYENYKGYYCRHPWVKRNCKYFCGHCVPKPRCNGKVDVSFIFEPTRGQTIAYQKYFIKTIVSAFGMSRDTSRASVITLGRKSELSINFQDYVKMTLFNEAVDEIIQPEGGEPTSFDDALAIAGQMFGETDGVRSDATKLLIILARDLDGKKLDAERSLQLADQLRRQGVVVVLIGKAPQKFHPELTKLTGDASNVMLYPALTELVSPDSIDAIINRVCTIVTNSSSKSMVEFDNNVPV